MRHAAALVLLLACGSPPAAAVEPTPPGPPTLADLGWLVGAWRGGGFDARWLPVATTLWGVSLGDTGFEVNIVDDSDDAGAPAPITLTGLDGTTATQFALRSATPRVIELTDGRQLVRFTHQPDGLHGELEEADQATTRFALQPAAIVGVPALEAADRQFADESARDGADAWGRWFAHDGVLWRARPVRGSDAIRAAIAASPAQHTLRWSPVASGARGELGFTLGTWVVAGGSAHGSYCTIWRREVGAWRAVFDVGRPANAAPARDRAAGVPGRGSVIDGAQTSGAPQPVTCTRRTGPGPEPRRASGGSRAAPCCA